MYRRSSVNEIAGYLNLPYEGPSIDILGVSSFTQLEANTVSFCTKKEIYLDERVLLIVPFDADVKSNKLSILRSENPRHTFAKVTQYLRKLHRKSIHKLALVDPAADLDDDVSVGPFSIVEAGVRVSKGTVIARHVTIKSGVEIGSDCILKSGSVVGEDGFGFGFDSDRTALKIVHTGGVRIGNHVEVGANSVICSGTIHPTDIGNYVKIDDLVFIAHNCRIGERSIIAASAEVSGSVVIGCRCWVGPNASIIDGVSIADDVMVGIGGIVTKDITTPSKHMSLEALPLRQLIALKRRIRFSER